MDKRVYEVWKGSNCSDGHELCVVCEIVGILLAGLRLIFVWFLVVVYVMGIGMHSEFRNFGKGGILRRFEDRENHENFSGALSAAAVAKETLQDRVTQLDGKKFFCGGRLIFGPDARSLLVTVLLILVPVVIFCTLVARHLRHAFPAYNAGYAILVVAVVLLLLLATSAQDPGIIPRASHPPEEEFSYESSASVEAGGRQTPSLQFPRTKDVTVNGMTRNYRYFFLFISSSTILCIYVFAMSALYIKIIMDNENGTVWKAIKESPASVVLIAYCFIILWFVGGLTGFHLYLIGTNQTTYENFRYRVDSRISVYNRGCLNNFLEVLCAKIKPSQNNFRAFVKEEVQKPPVPRPRDPEIGDLGEDPRRKIEDDLDIGGDLLKISQRRNFDGSHEDIDIRSRGSNGTHHDYSDAEFALGSDQQLPTARPEARHSSWGRRSGSWEISPDILGANGEAAQNKSYNP
ncbi:hypothetical protein Scep_000927 [Stephania cephalantha]|uniref:S-acyltransferase n=1 Tax=Stephania cephalantha TaxID=152367 RepID=A0AAP0L7I2_9MAGN